MVLVTSYSSSEFQVKDRESRGEGIDEGELSSSKVVRGESEMVRTCADVHVWVCLRCMEWLSHVLVLFRVKGNMSNILRIVSQPFLWYMFIGTTSVKDTVGNVARARVWRITLACLRVCIPGRRRRNS